MTTTDAECGSHTPGPWRQSPGGYIHGSDCIVAKVGSFEDAEITPQSGARWIADANLIAAAPELLAAAKQVCSESGPNMSPSLGSLAKLDAAIAKADGQSARE